MGIARREIVQEENENDGDYGKDKTQLWSTLPYVYNFTIKFNKFFITFKDTEIKWGSENRAGTLKVFLRRLIIFTIKINLWKPEQTYRNGRPGFLGSLDVNLTKYTFFLHQSSFQKLLVWRFLFYFI